ncbi:MAG: 2-C-methyl-D-erythritol 4-phosphate cytidylyltransferase [Myxococcota bacterium]
MSADRAGSDATAALVLAAGRGERLGEALPKAFVPLSGKTLVERSVRALASAGVFDVIQPVVAAADLDRWAKLDFDGVPGLRAPVAGGAERQDSMRAGLAALPADVGWVAVHDAARCLVSAVDLKAVVAAAKASGAALLGERSRDTLKRVREGRVVETPPRDELWAAQTPQVIRRDWLEAAMAAAVETGRLGTDDVQLVEWAGRPVTMVEATAPNPKITRPEDLRTAEALIAEREREG